MPRDRLVEGFERYLECRLSKECGSRYSNPKKVTRMIEDGIEARDGMKVSQDNVNQFTGLKRGAITEIKPSEPSKESKQLYHLTKAVNALVSELKATPTVTDK